MFTEDEFILGRMVRAVFRRSDSYLLGFYVENRDASRRVFYTFTEQVDGRTRDMVPGNVSHGRPQGVFRLGCQLPEF
ncbi:hypothetical protein ACWFR5_08010 [Streptomyces sp. NPDC055092]